MSRSFASGNDGYAKLLTLSCIALLTACSTEPKTSENSEAARECGAESSCSDDCSDATCSEAMRKKMGSRAEGNSSTLSGRKDITVSPPSGTFQSEILVSLQSSREEGEIRYTTDGSEVGPASALYEDKALQFVQSTELRARVFLDGTPVGEESMEWYVARDFDLEVDVPVMVIDSYGAEAPEREYIDAAVMTFETKGQRLSHPPTVASRGAFHLRGQSTAMFDKPPYRLELRDGEGEDLDRALVGLPAESDWVLRGPFADKALIRDAFFYGLGAEMGMVAPRFAHIELYRNVGEGPLSADDYLGVYLLVESIKNSKARLDLKQLSEEDTEAQKLSGGYIFKFEWLASEEPILACPGGQNCWNDLEVYDPLPLAAAQSEWLATHLRTFVDVLYSSNFADENLGYQAYIDADSFVDQIIVNELGREMDSYIRSAYFHKERDGKIVAGPLWDYNLSLDCGGFFDNRLTAGFQFEQKREPIANDWMARLLEDPAFEERLSTRWKELRQGLLSESALMARVDSLAAPLSAAAQRNFERWPNLTTESIGPFLTPTNDTWQGQVEVIRAWLKARAQWLDGAWQ